jgi:hypothetical protein
MYHKSVTVGRKYSHAGPRVSQVQRAMIGAMHEPPEHQLTDWSSDTFGYTSAYSSSYTVVYTHAKKVS